MNNANLSQILMRPGGRQVFFMTFFSEQYWMFCSLSVF